MKASLRQGEIIAKILEINVKCVHCMVPIVIYILCSINVQMMYGSTKIETIVRQNTYRVSKSTKDGYDQENLRNKLRS